MSGAGRAAWILVLALPALGFGARLLLAAREEARYSAAERALSPGDAGSREWTGDGALAGLGRVRTRVAPLHADRGRQEFEARTLRERAPALVGEPWLVVVEVTRAEGADSDSATRLDPRALRVEDGAGVALSIPDLGSRDGADPVATLFAPPAPIAAGERATLVLFGRAPEPGARLVLPGGGAIALEPAPLSTRGFDLPIARVDRRAVSSEGGQ